MALFPFCFKQFLALIFSSLEPILFLLFPLRKVSIQIITSMIYNKNKKKHLINILSKFPSPLRRGNKACENNLYINWNLVLNILTLCQEFFNNCFEIFNYLYESLSNVNRFLKFLSRSLVQRKQSTCPPFLPSWKPS